jgi:hypothetical protein
MSQFLTGSICLDDLLAALRAGHSAFSRSEKNGKVYVSIKEWVNDDADQYGNHASIQLNSTKTASAEEQAKKIYLGNLKIQSTGGAALSAEEAANLANSVNLAPQGAAPNAAGQAAGTPPATPPASATGAAPAGVPPGPAPAVGGDGLPF